MVLSCVLLAILFVEGGYSKRFKPAKNHPNRESSNVPKRPDDNGKFSIKCILDLMQIALSLIFYLYF